MVLLLLCSHYHMAFCSACSCNGGFVHCLSEEQTVINLVVRSELYGGCIKTIHPNFLMAVVVCTLLCILALSWRSNTSGIFLVGKIWKRQALGFVSTQSSAIVSETIIAQKHRSYQSIQWVWLVLVIECLTWRCCEVPLHWWLLGFVCNMVDPGCISCDSSQQEAFTPCTTSVQNISCDCFPCLRMLLATFVAPNSEHRHRNN